MSQITLVFGVAPAVAPVLGGVLLNLLGWRSIFWAMLVLSGAVLTWTLRSLPETLSAAHRQPLHPRALWSNYRAVLSTHEFLLLAAIPSLNFAALFLYVAAAPRFLVDLDDPHLHLLASLHDVGHLPHRPIRQLADVNQPFEAGFQLDERAEIDRPRHRGNLLMTTTPTAPL